MPIFLAIVIAFPFYILNIIYQLLKENKMSNTHRYTLSYLLLAVSFIIFGYFLISEREREFDAYSLFSYAFSIMTFCVSIAFFNSINSDDKTKEGK